MASATPRFVRLVRMWSHAVQRIQPSEDEVAELPCVLLAEAPAAGASAGPAALARLDQQRRACSSACGATALMRFCNGRAGVSGHDPGTLGKSTRRFIIIGWLRTERSGLAFIAGPRLCATGPQQIRSQCSSKHSRKSHEQVARLGRPGCRRRPGRLRQEGRNGRSGCRRRCRRRPAAAGAAAPPLPPLPTRRFCAAARCRCCRCQGRCRQGCRRRCLGHQD